jgi:GNAT superfamily N-acetyltransferase
MIREITFDEIYEVWAHKLWPGRKSLIESNSAMCFLGGYDMANMHTKPTFFGWFDNNNLVGVNSGHGTLQDGYRSRGLYVEPSYRGRGFGVQLLRATLQRARDERSHYCWSYPKKESQRTYEKAGFKLVTEWEQSETGMNAYCYTSLHPNYR